MYRKEGETRKSREQKFREFFETLQLEYITAELRYKIYPEGEKKQKSKDIMEWKRTKILDMAVRNSFKTIFPECKVGITSLFDQELKDCLYAKIYTEWGLPNFIYRDDEHKNQIGFLDQRYYFTIGREFRVKDHGTGVLRYVNTRENQAKVMVGNQIISCTLENISRVGL